MHGAGARKRMGQKIRIDERGLTAPFTLRVVIVGRRSQMGKWIMNDAQPPLNVAILPVTPLQQNCTLLWDAETKAGVVVDPGGDVPRIRQAIDEVEIRKEKPQFEVIEGFESGWGNWYAGE